VIRAKTPKQADSSIIIISAWVITLLVSLLPDIIFREMLGGIPTWLYWAKIALLGIFFIACLSWKFLRPLALFILILLVIFLLEWGINWFYHSISYSAWFVGQPAFIKNIASVQVPRATIGILIVLIMLLLFRSFKGFFFVKGKLDAEAAPIPLLMTRPASWCVLGPAIAVAMSLGLLVFTFVFGSLPTLQSIKHLGSFLPFIVLFAVSNSFGEEMLYRAPWLAALERPVGRTQALLLTATFFGIGHYYGVPYGIVGVVMAFIPGWLMGKAMLETRGFLWAWIIHFSMDFVIFSLIALGSIAPGG
jgi:membrane protease YdiL (CAAX protease family)